MKFVTEIKDPVHGYIPISDCERDIIDTLPVQRLRFIKQLAGAEYTYPGADHSRFCHSVGVMHLAGKFAERLYSLGEIEEDFIQMLRLAGLLHDVGHGPFSHNYEELLYEKRKLTHEDIGQRVVAKSEIADKLSDHGFNPREISTLAVGRNKKLPTYVNQVIAGIFDADKIDYLLRDSYFTGVEYGRQVDAYRIINSTVVVDTHLAVKQAALPSIESFFIARYEMFKAVYYHRSVRSAEILLLMAMRASDEELGLTEVDDIEHFLTLTDISVFSKMYEIGGKSREYVDMLRRRKLLKAAYERVFHFEDRAQVSILTSRLLLSSVEKRIKEEAGLDEDVPVVIDTPTLPSFPYYPGSTTLSDLYIVFEVGEGEYQRIPSSELSILTRSLRTFLDILRVYTFDEYREQVSKAAKKVLGGEILSTEVSY
ncbi:phosphohydrolase [archaeon]|nr:MAG: phosphohydrolase [archaeon]RLG65300.1 MAG: phosphohydrolase [archaeon]HDM23842.1 HD domain-containing protein [Candidatus Bathyarchaeota archaeon]